MKTKIQTIGKALSRNELKQVTGGTSNIACSVTGFQCNTGQCCVKGKCVVQTPTTVCDF